MIKPDDKERMQTILAECDMIPYEGCWLHPGLTRKGYSRFYWNGKYERGHRVTYAYFRGEIPPGMLVCHTCDNRDCINPDHLFLGTNKMNMADCVSKGRIARGTKQGASKLTNGDVHFIRNELARGITCEELGERYCVADTTIGAIKHGKNWGWLKEQPAPSYGSL